MSGIHRRVGGNCGSQQSSGSCGPQKSKGGSGEHSKVGGGSGEKSGIGGSGEKSKAKAAGVPYGQWKKQMEDRFDGWKGDLQSYVQSQNGSSQGSIFDSRSGGGFLSGVMNFVGDLFGWGDHNKDFLNNTGHSTPTAVANGQSKTPLPVDLGNPTAIGSAKPLPWVDQYSPAGSEDGKYLNGAQNCGPALLASIAKANGLQPLGQTDAALITEKMAKAGTTGDGTTGNGMIAALADMGMQTAARPGADMNWINSQLAQGHEVLANGNFYAIAEHPDPDQVAGHYIAVTGVQGGVYRVTDPADKSVTQMTAEQLATFINQHPEGGFAISTWT